LPLVARWLAQRTDAFPAVAPRLVPVGVAWARRALGLAVVLTGVASIAGRVGDAANAIASLARPLVKAKPELTLE
jgi:hypothetical protein